MTDIIETIIQSPVLEIVEDETEVIEVYKGIKGDPGDVTGGASPAAVQAVADSVTAEAAARAAGDTDAKNRANHTGTQSADTLTDGSTNKAFLATERVKLSSIATGATVNDTDANLKNRANHTGTQSADTLTDGTTNKAFLATERTKLSGIATGATANDTDANLKNRANHSGTQTSATISDFTEAVQDAVNALLVGTSGVTLSYDDAANSLTITGPGTSGLDAEAVRDAIGVAMVGTGNITVAVNDAADTITITTTATVNSTDAALRDRSTHTGTQSADTVVDGTTNKAYTSTEKTKLSGIATGATVNSTDAALRDRSTHTGTQSADTLTDGSTNKAFLATERTKLSSVATGATANDTDANLKNRANHTGTQTASTISDLTETTQDTVGAMLVEGANIDLTYDDTAGTVTIASTATGGTSGADKDSVLLDRLERQVRQKIDSYNRKVIARANDATLFTELWENTNNWVGTGTVANGQMYNAAAAMSRGISLPVGAGRRIIRGVLTLTSSTAYAYLGVSADAPGAAVTLGNSALIGISNTNVQASIGANITGTASNTVGGVKSAGDYLVTVVIDEESISFSVQAISNPGVTINSFSLLRSQFPSGAINTIVVSNSSSTTGLVWGPIQDITEIMTPPKGQQAPGGKILWGAAAPIHINHKSPGHQVLSMTGTAGTFTVTYAGQTTAALAYNITGPDLKTALEGLSTIGVGNASVNKAGTKWAVRLKGSLGLVPMTVTPTITGGTVTVTQGAVRWFMQIPGDYDPRTPIPFVQSLHWSLTATGINIFTDARWTSTFNNLIGAGYAFMSSDNGPETTNGGLQDSFGNQYGIDDYADQVDWFRRHFHTGSLYLIGASQGGIFVENILASRKYNAVGNIAAVASVSPARDLVAIVPNATFTTVFEDAYGASSTSDFATKVVGYNPIDLDPQQVRGVPHRDYVATADTTTDEAVQTVPFFTKINGWVPEHPMWTNASSTHLDSGLFVQMATEIVSYFDTYNTTDHSSVGVSANKGVSKRVYTTTSTAALTPDVDNYDIEILTLQSAALTIAAPVGTPVSGTSFILRIKDDSTARAITWNSIYRGIGVTLPTTTTAGKVMYIAVLWNSVALKYDVIAVAQEA